MTAPATVPDARALAHCGDCGGSVVHAYTAAGQRLVVLDPEPVDGALYELDEHGRAVRRNLVALYQASREGLPLLGLDLHQCAPREWWARD